MDIALITGADTALGQNLAERLIRMGCRVHGIGNDFSNVTLADRDFSGHAVDLTDPGAVRAALEGILEEEQALHLLVHAIDVTPATPFDKLAVGNLEAVLRVALLAPVLLTRLALPNLLRFRGQVVNILSSNKAGQPASAVNSLIEDGLRGMNRTLQEDEGGRGLRLTNIVLRHNQTLTADGGALPEHARIDYARVAALVERLLAGDERNVPSEIVLHPPAAPDASGVPQSPLPVDAYSRVLLPPKAYFPPEPEKIPTKEPDRIDRSIPFTEEELEDRIADAIEAFETRQESRQRPAQSKPSAGGDDSGEKKPGRRRRRRGRRGKGQAAEPGENAPAQKDTSETPPTPKPPEPVQPATPEKEKGRVDEASEPEKAPPKKAAGKKAAVKKTSARKTPAKKAAKKATKKVATRKTVKKAAKKAARKATKKTVKSEQAE